jgi:dolichyl-phosphate beta-glucosyltransferase
MADFGRFPARYARYPSNCQSASPPVAFRTVAVDAPLSQVFPSLGVIVPAYNAATHVGQTLRTIRAWLTAQGVDFELIVVDDGSADDTAAIAEREGADQVLRNDRNRGKGYAVRRGMLASQAAWRLFLDVDHSTPIQTLADCVEPARRAAVVIGSRRVKGAKIVRRQPRIRQALGRTFPYIVRAVALPDIRDTQCGFKLFRADAAEAIFRRQRVDRFAFDVEVLLLAKNLGYAVEEVPVAWSNPPGSTLRVGADSTRMLWDLMKTVWRLRGGRTGE